MTTADQPNRKTVWIAHHFTPLMIVGLAPMMINSVFPDIDALTIIGLITTPISWSVIIASDRHQSLLCWRCAADFPVDGERQAQDKLGALRYHHHYSAALRLLVLVACIASAWVPWLWLFVCVWFFVDHRMLTHHRRLVLWCPWCRHGRGDDDLEMSPPPVPTMSKSR